jgi:hypothetical protein
MLDETHRLQDIGCGGPIRWPVRSADLNACDFCIWGYLKIQVNTPTVNTMEKL